LEENALAGLVLWDALYNMVCAGSYSPMSFCRLVIFKQEHHEPDVVFENILDKFASCVHNYIPKS